MIRHPFSALVVILSLNFLSGKCAWSQTPVAAVSPARLGIVGDSLDVQTKTEPGLVLMGGGKNSNAALKWMIARSGGGDAVLLTSSLDEPNQALYRLGGLNSVETLKIDSRALADDERTAQTIRSAEMVFIGGGKQSEYLSFWKDTKTMAALNYLLNEKHVPVGGSSAGCAVLTGLYYSGQSGSVTSSMALADPYNHSVSLGKNDFLKAPFLENVISDTHYLTRGRQGRHMAFLARIAQDWTLTAKGIGVDEGTAVCVDSQGKACVLGASKAYFLESSSIQEPEICHPKQPLTWDRGRQAVKAFEMSASPKQFFDLVTWAPVEEKFGSTAWWWVENGIFHARPIP